MTSDCPHEQDVETAERYVRGTLPELEQTAFEAHFFTCERCLADVRALQDLWQVMVKSAVATRTPTSAAGPAKPGAQRQWMWWAGLAAAALILVALATPVRLRWGGTGTPAATVASRPPTGDAPVPAAGSPVPGPTPSPAPGPPGAPDASRVPPLDRAALLHQLAIVVAPPYVRLPTRGATGPATTTFDEAMAQYSGGRYLEAATRLRVIADGTEQAEQARARYFLGICELLQGRAAPARQVLVQVSASGVQPYADEAHFYLAKAALAAADVDTAKRELALAVDREAGPEGEAARLLAQLR